MGEFLSIAMMSTALGVFVIVGLLFYALGACLLWPA
jgi:hypothetical protein